MKNRTDLERTIADELARIPRGELAQNELRMVYNALRRHDLALDRNCPASTSLARAIKSVMTNNPYFVPRYEASFFVG